MILCQVLHDGPLHKLLGAFSTVISTADGTVAATCEVERTTPHGPACASDGPRHIYDCPKACGSHADILGHPRHGPVYMIRVVSAPCGCTASTSISTSVSPLYIYVSSRHGGCRASTALQPSTLYSSTLLYTLQPLHSPSDSAQTGTAEFATLQNETSPRHLLLIRSDLACAQLIPARSQATS